MIRPGRRCFMAQAQPATGAPITVTGCLRAGDAPETYVLMSIQRGSTPETATYQLIGKEGVDFQHHMGQEVQLTGTLGTQAERASRAAATTEPKAKGTSGTPSVQTETDLQVRALHVDSLTPQAGTCQR
ncbi:MAG: hypothetical protein ACRD1V_01745 [Vicinamibacterales bacterium]